MHILLSKQQNRMQNLEQSLASEKLISIFNQTNYQKVLLKLPKFSTRLSLDLNHILQKIEINQIFLDSANFSRMPNQKLMVSKAVHEAFIKVRLFLLGTL